MKSEIPKLKLKPQEITHLKLIIKSTMWKNVGIVRSETSLKDALTKLDSVLKKLDCEPNVKEEIELKNMAQVAKLVTEAALKRKASIGAHFRSDYPGG